MKNVMKSCFETIQSENRYFSPKISELIEIRQGFPIIFTGQAHLAFRTAWQNCQVMKQSWQVEVDK